MEQEQVEDGILMKNKEVSHLIQTGNKNYSKIRPYQGEENDTKIIVSDKNQKEYGDTSNEPKKSMGDR